MPRHRSSYFNNRTFSFVSMVTESSGVETSPSTVLSPDDTPSNQAAVANGDLSGSEHAPGDTSGHVEESTYEPVSVGAQVRRH